MWEGGVHGGGVRTVGVRCGAQWCVVWSAVVGTTGSATKVETEILLVPGGASRIPISLKSWGQCGPISKATQAMRPAGLMPRVPFEPWNQLVPCQEHRGPERAPRGPGRAPCEYMHVDVCVYARTRMRTDAQSQSRPGSGEEREERERERERAEGERGVQGEEEK